MTIKRAVWIFVIALTVIRLSMLATKDLEFDEAHYWLWSGRLAPAYFTKGPAIAFVMRASTAIFGSNEFGVRFFSPILAPPPVFSSFISGAACSANAALWLVLGLNATPIFNIGGFLMTIDPLTFSFGPPRCSPSGWPWKNPRGFPSYWPLTGPAHWFRFLSKYTNALELISVILVLALAPRLRQEFAKPGLYSLLGVFILCTIPPIIWNSQHAWVTISHLETKGA